MFLPKIVHSVKGTVHRLKNTIHLSLITNHLRRSRKGFSIMEILVVITIIAILVAVATASYTAAQKKGRDSKRKGDLKAIQQALELYFQANGQYPPSSNGTWCARLYHITYPELRNALTTTYIKQIPQDPLYSIGITGNTNSDYVYRNLSWNGYEMAARLENTNDSEAATSPYTQFDPCPGTTDGVYNYRVTNP